MKKGKENEGDIDKKRRFMVIVLGIIFDPKKRKILIAKRKPDESVPELTWAFPGGRAKYTEDLEETIKRKIDDTTGLKIENLGIVFARAPPEKKDILLLYYLCEAIGGKEKPDRDKIKELKWVAPEKLEKYFTTSFHPNLKEYIMNLK